MKTFVQRLKKKWGVTSNWQFLIINVVFAITGSSVVFIRKPIFEFLELGEATPFVVLAISYIVIVTPVYFTLLLVVAFIFGQFRFFWNFEKRMFSRLGRRRQSEVQE